VAGLYAAPSGGDGDDHVRSCPDWMARRARDCQLLRSCWQTFRAHWGWGVCFRFMIGGLEASYVHHGPGSEWRREMDEVDLISPEKRREILGFRSNVLKKLKANTSLSFRWGHA
jgi:hypothetical protein